MNTKKRIFVLLFSAHAAAGLMLGLVKLAPRTQGLVEYALSIAVIVSIYVWCRSDLWLRRPQRTSRWALWSALVPYVILPLYLFRTRPPAKAFMALAQGAGTYILLMVIFVVAALAAGATGAA